MFLYIGYLKAHNANINIQRSLNIAVLTGLVYRLKKLCRNFIQVEKDQIVNPDI